MIVAVDRVTGEVVGQVVSRAWSVSRDAAGFFTPMTLLLTGEGYKTVPCESVRLEKV